MKLFSPSKRMISFHLNGQLTETILEKLYYNHHYLCWSYRDPLFEEGETFRQKVDQVVKATSTGYIQAIGALLESQHDVRAAQQLV